MHEKLSTHAQSTLVMQVPRLQPDVLSPSEIMHLRMAAKHTFELEETFLQQETFKTADPGTTAGLLLLMQQEWQRQLVDLCTERGQKFVYQPSRPDVPPPPAPPSFALPGVYPSSRVPTLPLVSAPDENVSLTVLLDALIPPAPMANIPSPTVIGRQLRNSEEGLDCFEQVSTL